MQRTCVQKKEQKANVTPILDVMQARQVTKVTKPENLDEQNSSHFVLTKAAVNASLFATEPLWLHLGN